MRLKQPKTVSPCPLEWIAHTRGIFSSLLVYETSIAGAMDESVLTKPRSSSKKRIGFFISWKTKYSPLRIGFFSFPFVASVDAFSSAFLALDDVLLEVFRFLALDDALCASLSSIAASVSSTFGK